jgi:hypothetical protein
VGSRLDISDLRQARRACRHWSECITTAVTSYDPPLELDLCTNRELWQHKVQAIKGLFPYLRSCQVRAQS